MTPTLRDILPPQMMRERMSRPKWSVPNQCSADAGCMRWTMLWSIGSYREM